MKRCWFTLFLTVSLLVAAGMHLVSRDSAEAAVPETETASSVVRDETSVSVDPEMDGDSTGSDLIGTKPTETDSLVADELAVPEETETQDVPPHKEFAVDGDFKGVLFIGDSRTIGLSDYGDLGEAEVFANSGMSVFNLFDAQVSSKGGEKKNLEEMLTETGFQTIFLMLGINELGYDYASTVSRYETVVKKIRELQPSAALVLEANLHVTQEKSDSSEIYNNKNIGALNRDIQKIAERTGCYYIDINEIFDDQNGSLDVEYSVDGSHVMGKYYAEWVEWIKNSMSQTYQ